MLRKRKPTAAETIDRSKGLVKRSEQIVAYSRALAERIAATHRRHMRILAGRRLSHDQP